MTSREKLQLVYELAFFPPRLDQFWNRLKRNEVQDRELAKDLIDKALSLHQALPETGYSSQRALKRLANYQADARAFGTVTFLKNIRKQLDPKTDILPETVPAAMVRDIGLPPFDRNIDKIPSI